MKALKEKRVSLRSLFRRSLVILSLLALAFAVAACSDSGGSGGGDTEGTNGGTGSTEPTQAAKKFVTNMTVLKHPINPSYEGAAPDLTGIEVLVKWSSGEEKSVTASTSFAVYPPVAYVTQAGTHEWYSPYGRYGIQYIDEDDIYNEGAYRTNVYIPAVFALETTAGTIDGKIGIVYEDLGIRAEPGEVKYVGDYATFDFDEYTALTSLPKDTNWVKYDQEGFTQEKKNGSLVPREAWESFTAGTDNAKKKNNVSTSPEVWRLEPRQDGGATLKATYLARTTLPQSSGGHVEDVRDVEIDNFYRVDRLDYNDSGKEILKVGAVAADNEDLGGNNVTWTSGTDYAHRAWNLSAFPDDQKRNWMEKLLEAGIKFNVVYYLEKGKADAAKYKTRPITMSDYVRAMHTVDEDGTPKATLPIMVGAGQKETAQGSGTYIDPSSPQHWAYTDGEYSLYVSLFYYSDLIKPYSAGDPESDRSYYGNGRVKATSGTYLNSNGAIIPIATDEFTLVAQFSRFISERKDDTVHGGEPVIKGSAVDYDTHTTTVNGVLVRDYPDSKASLYNQLQMYWTAKWEYTNPLDASKPISIEIPKWYTWNGDTTDADGYGKMERVGLIDSDFTDIETEEIRTCEVLFPAPPSMGNSEDDSLEFDYYVKP